MNRLFYGDNLHVMSQLMGNHAVDLIYLDPPFKSNRTYNLLYSQRIGRPIPEQEEAFCDTWDLDAEKKELVKAMPVFMRDHGINEFYVRFWKYWTDALYHTQPKLLAYLVYMVQRLMYMKLILKPTGSIYLHCDPEASHYIKVMMDAIFGHENYQNEIIWKRTSAHSDAKKLGSVHDTLFFYSMSDTFTFNAQYGPYDESYIKSHYYRTDKKGRQYRTDNVTAGGLSGGGYDYEWNGVTKTWRYPKERMQELHEEGRLYYTRSGSPEYIRYLDEMPGVHVNDIWTDIPPLNSPDKKRLGFQTQKPPDLLKRIIELSSNPGDVVLIRSVGVGRLYMPRMKRDGNG